MTKMIFVRHGQSEANLAKIFAGHTDIPLTELGRCQAENTARFLKDYPIDVIYASDLLRAMQTAEPTAQMHGLEIIPNERLREIYAGDWEGVSFSDLLEKYPKEFGDVWRNDCGRAHPENGESVLALSERIYAEVDRLAALHRGGCVAIFSHATPIRLLCARWQGYPAVDVSKVTFCGNASVSVIDYEDDGSYTVHLCGYDGHQGSLSTCFERGSV